MSRKRTQTGNVFIAVLVGLIGFFLVYYFYTRVIYEPPWERAAKEKPQKIHQIEEIPITEKGLKIKEKHPGWSNDICNIVAEKKISIGMTEEQVIASWGKPYKINTTTDSWGKHSQWVMRDSINSDYVYFENGILTSIQQSK
jgi:regulatory protein YycI of two-component signal transduction system YycFG